MRLKYTTKIIKSKQKEKERKLKKKKSTTKKLNKETVWQRNLGPCISSVWVNTNEKIQQLHECKTMYVWGFGLFRVEKKKYKWMFAAG